MSKIQRLPVMMSMRMCVIMQDIAKTKATDIAVVTALAIQLDHAMAIEYPKIDWRHVFVHQYKGIEIDAEEEMQKYLREQRKDSVSVLQQIHFEFQEESELFVMLLASANYLHRDWHKHFRVVLYRYLFYWSHFDPHLYGLHFFPRNDSQEFVSYLL